MGMRVMLLIGTNIAVVALFTAAAAAFGVNPSGLVGLTIFSLALGFGGALVSLAMSKKIALRSTGAHVIETPTNETEKWLFDTIARQAADAGIGMPTVAIYPSEDVNAFATGAKRNDALVAVSVGLLRNMQADEVEAVLAHEISHVANGDMITLTLIQGIINTFVILISRVLANIVTNALTRGRGGRGVYFLVVMVLQVILGFFASIIVMWFSRRREFRADSGAAALASPQKMISALEALKRGAPTAGLPDEVAAFGIRAGEGGGLRRLLRTHPDLDERIAALR
ncbi:MAG: protease HtpX [Acidimicrobiales bacterium]|nr:protease HtpX [Acidimicrobiales bacterium]